MKSCTLLDRNLKLFLVTRYRTSKIHLHEILLHLIGVSARLSDRKCGFMWVICQDWEENLVNVNCFERDRDLLGDCFLLIIRLCKMSCFGGEITGF